MALSPDSCCVNYQCPTCIFMSSIVILACIKCLKCITCPTPILSSPSRAVPSFYISPTHLFPFSIFLSPLHHHLELTNQKNATTVATHSTNVMSPSSVDQLRLELPTLEKAASLSEKLKAKLKSDLKHVVSQIDTFTRKLISQHPKSSSLSLLETLNNDLKAELQALGKSSALVSVTDRVRFERAYGNVQAIWRDFQRVVRIVAAARQKQTQRASSGGGKSR